MRTPATPQGVLAEQLRLAIAQRDPAAVQRLFGAFDVNATPLDPTHPESAVLLNMLARSIDLDWGAAGDWARSVRALLDLFLDVDPGDLQSRARVHIVLAGGILQFHENTYDDAVTTLRRALQMADDIHDGDLALVTRYYLARCHWKRVEYHDALDHARQAVAADPWPQRRAVTQMVQAWLYFLTGHFDLARKVLDEADAVLRGTEDLVNHANILSFRGRLSRLKERANAHETKQFFRDARDAYVKVNPSNPTHRNIARCDTNLAMHYRCQANDVMSQQTMPLDDREHQAAQYREHARRHLNLADELYRVTYPHDHRGRGTVENIRALLLLDERQFRQARATAEGAFQIGKDKDRVVMANARVISALATLKDGAPKAALKPAEEAIALAEQTDNRRLRIRALLTKARVELAPHSGGELQRARELCQDAHGLLEPEEDDYLRADYDAVMRELEEATHESKVVVGLTKREINNGQDLDSILQRVRNQIVVERWNERGSKTQEQVARDLGIGPSTLRTILQGMGIDTRPTPPTITGPAPSP